VTTVVFSPYLLTTHPSVPVKNVAELIALAKANPGKLNAPVGLGSNIHMSTLALQQRVGAKWVYIPTKGGQSSVLSVMTGDGDFLFMGVIQTWVHVKSGKLKLIAVSSERREPTFPDVPTVAETPRLVAGHHRAREAPRRHRQPAAQRGEAHHRAARRRRKAHLARLASPGENAARNGRVARVGEGQVGEGGEGERTQGRVRNP